MGEMIAGARRSSRSSRLSRARSGRRVGRCSRLLGLPRLARREPLERPRSQFEKAENAMVQSSRQLGSAVYWEATAPGAQIERPGAAWPVRVLLGGDPSPAAFISDTLQWNRRSRVRYLAQC